MDFSKIKAITIPEGAVTRITCGGAVLWKKLTGRIPNEYQEVEWIGTDGNSYFVSNFTINALDRFTLYYRYSSPSGNNYMFGASNKLNSESAVPRFLHRRGDFIYNSAQNDTTYATEAVTHDGSFHTMEGRFVHNGSALLYKDGVQVKSTSFYNFRIFDMLGVFCNNYYQQPASHRAVSGSKIAELRFVDDTTGNDVFNPIPCYRKADGVIGMYDTVSKTFFTNQGTGSFTKGASVGGYTNLVPLSTEADGTTIYNGGLGYKDGYRVRSGGAEAAYEFGAVTGYIPYKKGDKLYIYPAFVGRNTNNAINFSDSTFTNIGQVTDSSSAYGICAGHLAEFQTTVINGVSVLDLSSVTVSGVDDVAYVRITNFIKSENNLVSSITSGSEMIITKNEEIPL